MLWSEPNPAIAAMVLITNGAMDEALTAETSEIAKYMVSVTRVITVVVVVVVVVSFELPPRL
jgi:hypothetical protein